MYYIIIYIIYEIKEICKIYINMAFKKINVQIEFI